MHPAVLSGLAASQLADLVIFASNGEMFVSLGREGCSRVGKQPQFFVSITGRSPDLCFGIAKGDTLAGVIDCLWTKVSVEDSQRLLLREANQ